MNRRRCFSTIFGLLGTTALSRNCEAKVRPRRRLEPRTRQYPPPTILTRDTKAQDARPCFSPDGSQVLFMRNQILKTHPNLPPTLGPTQFWTVPTQGGSESLFVRNDHLQFTRPDWSWNRSEYEIAFDGIENGRPSIFLLDSSTRRYERILEGDDRENRIYSYPSWYPGGRFLSITNYWTAESNDPDTRQALLLLNLNGDTRPLTSPNLIWPGMSSVFPGPACSDDISPPIAFAGERPNSEGYNQDDNQIWIRHSDGSVAPIDGKQARAPWWSPNGRLLAFESNRLTRKNYQIFLQSPFQPQFIQAITPRTLGVQHAKFSPNGRFVVFAYSINETAQGIAMVDLGAS